MEILQKETDCQDRTGPENIKQGAARRGKKPPKKITEKYLYNSGLAYLQRFPTSTPHFRRIMGRKIDRSCNYHKDQGADECRKLLESAVATFTRMGLLNDTAWIQGMVTSLRRRGLSAQAIQSKLSQKGVAQAAVLEALSAHDEDRGQQEPELAAALLLCRRKRIGPFRRDEEGTDRTKELAALARSGFGFDTAQKALSLTPDEAEDILSSIRS